MAKEFFDAKASVCYDRSRVIEKALKYYGYEVRHLAIYSSRKRPPSVYDVFRKNSISHSISEVLTSKGWMIVDSNHKWIGLDINNHPISVKSLKKKIPEW